MDIKQASEISKIPDGHQKQQAQPVDRSQPDEQFQHVRIQGTRPYLSSRKSIGDPLKLLPAELWLQAMHAFVDEDPDRVFTLMLISKDWERTVISTPNLWVNIVIREGHDSICRPYVHRILSRDLQISVTFVQPMDLEAFEANLNIVNEEAHRIREIRFLDDYAAIPYDIHRNNSNLYDRINRIFSVVEALPALERLESLFPYGHTPVLAYNPMPAVPNLLHLAGWSLESTSLELI